MSTLSPSEAVSTVVLVEGISDQHALEALARRRGRDLVSEGISIVSMGGTRNIGRCLERYGPQGAALRLAGLCDEGEERDVGRALERTGHGHALSRDDMERLGFFVCVRDLEDELIRALGASAVQRVIEGRGELASFGTFQKQPEWRNRPIEEQLRRFFGTYSGRKIESASLLVEALDLDRVPQPLDRLLAFLSG